MDVARLFALALPVAKNCKPASPSLPASGSLPNCCAPLLTLPRPLCIVWLPIATRVLLARLKFHEIINPSMT